MLSSSSRLFTYTVSFFLAASLLLIYHQYQQLPEEQLNQSRAVSFGSKYAVLVLSNQNVDRSGESTNQALLRRVMDNASFQLVERRQDVVDWQLLWVEDVTKQDKYRLGKIKEKLEPHQRLNLFPGMEFAACKKRLTFLSLPRVLKWFKLPEQPDLLRDFAAGRDDLWLVQNGQLRRPNQVDMRADSFVREVLMPAQGPDDLLLMDGRLFDVGVYTAVTSVEPLRVYVYEDDVAMRVGRRPVGGDAATLQQESLPQESFEDEQRCLLPTLKTIHFDLGYSLKQTLNYRIRSVSNDGQRSVEQVWKQIYDHIRSVFMANEQLMQEAHSQYKKHVQQNFFEIVRFDFELDSQLNVFLKELVRTPHFEEGVPAKGGVSGLDETEEESLGENVLRAGLSLAGVIPARAKTGGSMERITVIPSLHPEECKSSPICLGKEACEDPRCFLCRNCLEEQDELEFSKAISETASQNSFRRIYPESVSNPQEARERIKSISPEKGKKLSRSNLKMHLWYLWRCSTSSLGDERKMWC